MPGSDWGQNIESTVLSRRRQVYNGPAILRGGAFGGPADQANSHDQVNLAETSVGTRAWRFGPEGPSPGKELILNILDYVLLAGLLGFGVFGFVKGFFKQALVIAGLGLAFFLASKYHTNVAEMNFLSSVRERSESVALVGSFLAILFAVAALSSVIATLIGRRISRLSIGSGDRWLGSFLGLVIGAVVLGGVTLGLKEWEYGAVGDIPEEADGFIAESALVPFLSDVCLTLVALVPQESRDEAQRIYEERFRHGNDDPVILPPEVVKSNNPGTSGLLSIGIQRSLFRKVSEESESARAVPAGAQSEGKVEPALQRESKPGSK